jgi:hypothetical protein
MQQSAINNVYDCMQLHNKVAQKASQILDESLAIEIRIFRL